MINLAQRFKFASVVYGIDFAYSKFVVPINDFPMQYFYAGMFGVLTAFVLYFLEKSKLQKNLIILHIFWIAIHCYGFIIYMCYIKPYSYDLAQTGMHIVQIIIIGVGNDGISDYWRSHIRHNDFNLYRIFFKR